MNYINTSNDIYIFPSQSEGKCILYSPLRDVSLYISHNVAHQLIKYYQFNKSTTSNEINKLINTLAQTEIKYPKYEPDVEIRNKAVILLSNSCNFACSYCYAKESRNNSILSKNQIKAIVDYVYSFPSPKKVFSFLGGGEPLVTWDLFKWSIEYILEVNKTIDTKVVIGLTTNGSLLNEERIIWLKKHVDRVGISFEILPEIQNTSRPIKIKSLSSFKIVDNSIRLMVSHHVPFKLRSTITQASVDKMEEMLEFATKRYSGIKDLHFEPVCDVSENSKKYYDNFVNNFMKAYAKGRRQGVLVQNSITNALFHIREHYCVGELCVTPDGDIVTCHRHSNRNDDSYKQFKFGYVSDKNVNIDSTLLEKVTAYRMSRRTECSNCFARWNCAGGCTSVRSTLSKAQQDEYCSFIQELLKSLIEYHLTI